MSVDQGPQQTQDPKSPPKQPRGLGRAAAVASQWLELRSWKRGMVSAGQSVKRTALFTGHLWRGLWIKREQIPTATTTNGLRLAARREIAALAAWGVFAAFALIAATQAQKPWSLLLLFIGLVFVLRACIALYIYLAASAALANGQQGTNDD